MVAANTRRICEARERRKQEYQLLEAQVAGKDMTLPEKRLQLLHMWQVPSTVWHVGCDGSHGCAAEAFPFYDYSVLGGRM